MVSTFEKVTGKPIPYTISSRRPGDIGACYADPTKAELELGWVAEKGIHEMCTDSWRWQSNNPNGYQVESKIPAGIGVKDDLRMLSRRRDKIVNS
jgi:UDP-glucose 4-epimerase